MKTYSLKTNRKKLRMRIRTLQFLLGFYLNSDRKKNQAIIESAKNMINGLEEVEIIYDI